MQYILITLLSLSCFNGYYVFSTEKANFSTCKQFKVNDITYANKEDLAKAIKVCKDDTSCEIVTIIGCPGKGCKEYEYSLKTEPEIKNSVELKEK